MRAYLRVLFIDKCECDVCVGAPHAKNTRQDRIKFHCKEAHIQPSHKGLVHTMFTHQLHTSRIMLSYYPGQMIQVVELYDEVWSEMRKIQKENEAIDKLLNSLGGGT